MILTPKLFVTMLVWLLLYFRMPFDVTLFAAALLLCLAKKPLASGDRVHPGR